MKKDFFEIMRIDDDMERNEALYKFFNEDDRLRSRVGQIEFKTTMKYIERYIHPGAKILDVGAGTGAYSLELANKGYKVTAFEPSSANYNILKQKADALKNNNLTIKNSSSYDMKQLPNEYFDAILLFGPLYHISDYNERLRIIEQAKRICKKNGTIFAAFINHDMIPITETMYDPNWFSNDSYNHDTLRIIDRPFIFLKLDECINLIKNADLNILHTVASDGFSEILGEKLNAMSELSYSQYYKWHLANCEKMHMLGATNHLLFVCNKQTSDRHIRPKMYL